MKKATKMTMTAVVLLFVAAIATSAFGFGWGRGPGCGYGPMGRGDVAGLAGVELTADQQAQIKSMRDAQFEELKPLRAEMFAKRDAVRALWLEATPDQAKIKAAQQEMRLLRDQLQDKMTAFRLEVLNVLTPEQREKLKSAVPGRGFGPRGGGCAGGGYAGGGCVGGAPGSGIGPGAGPGAGQGPRGIR